MTGRGGKSGHPILRVSRVRDFRLLWIGQSLSLLGDQFYMIALPWLVLQVTGSALALGTVLALEAIPRALFVLVGGAVTDRVSARTVMLVSDVARLMMTALLTVLVFTGGMNLWMIYGFALAFGLVDGFFAPATASIVPHIVDGDDLQTGNALVHGAGQLSVFVGPVLAGILIAVGSTVSSAVPETGGIGLAFAIDTATFLVSVVTLCMMGTMASSMPDEASEQQGHVLASIRGGISYMWNDATLRTMFVLVAAVNFLVNGPFLVGIPVLADSRLPEGAAAFGLIVSAHGGGNLLGFVLSGAIPSARRLNIIIPAVFALFGIGIASLGFVGSTAVAFMLVLVMGIGNGYISIVLITWLQKRTAKSMLGRLMSLVMVASAGLLPVSEAISGVVIGLSLPGLFAGAGVLLILVALWAAVLPEMRSLKLEMGEEAVATTS